MRVEIPRAEWSQALVQFNAIHEGWLVSLEVVTYGAGGQRVMTNLPLVAVTLDDAESTVSVTAGRPGVGHVTHAIHAPRRLWFERTEGGADSALGAESADGAATILWLKNAVLPETVDGIARSR